MAHYAIGLGAIIIVDHVCLRPGQFDFALVSLYAREAYFDVSRLLVDAYIDVCSRALALIVVLVFVTGELNERTCCKS